MKIKRTGGTESTKRNLVNSVLTSTENIRNGSDMTEIGQTFLTQVITVASQKRAQDKTTARRAEFTQNSNGLFFFKAAQTGNVLATAANVSNRDMFGRLVQKARPYSLIIHQDLEYNKFDAVDQTLERVYFTSTTTAGGVNHLLDHADQFELIDPITRCNGELNNFAENITCARLERMTDDTMVGASTAAASRDDLGTIANRTSKSQSQQLTRVRLCQRYKSFKR